MPLLSASEILLLIASGVAGVTSGFAVFDALRARQRLAAGKCSRCGQPWSAAYPDPERYLVQGREVCGPCATILRDRLPRLMRRLGWVGAFAVGWILFELGLQPALESRLSVGWLMTGLSLPVLFSATTIAALALAARRNRAVLGASRQPEQLGAPDDEL